MSIFSSLKRYIMTLGGLIGGDIDSRTEEMLSTPSGVKATFQQTRDNWTKQYGEVREAVAQLMMVLEQKKSQVDKLSQQMKDNETRLRGAVQQFKATNDTKYQQAFTEIYNRQEAHKAEQEQLNAEIMDLQGKVNQYKQKLAEMQKQIAELKKQEAAAIADIVSSKQIISLNDRLNNLSTQLDDRNLQAIQERRESLKAQASLSESLATGDVEHHMEEELMKAGMQSEAADVFAAMLKEDEQRQLARDEERPESAARKREI